MHARGLIRLFLLLALLVAPLGMAGRHAAMAAPHAPAAAAAAGHCAEMPADHGSKRGGEAPAPGKSIDCMIACSCVPTTGPQLRDPPEPVAEAAQALIAATLRGLNPAADPPPPRFS